MNRTRVLLLILAAAALLVTGCSESPTGPTSSSVEEPTIEKGVQPSMSLCVTPTNELQSATLNMFVMVGNGEPVNVHRVTGDWDENTVTWSSFGADYTTDISGTFVASGYGWVSVDVTDLVAGWMNGTNTNYGLLLDQADAASPWTRILSREDDTRPPYLTICYTTDGEEVCEDLVPAADAYVFETAPETNYGSSVSSYTGWLDNEGGEKQTLMRFQIEVDITPSPSTGCTRTIGYWKNHAGGWHRHDAITPLLGRGIWLGDPHGRHSIRVRSSWLAVQILKSWGRHWHKNGIRKLRAQLLAAKLNIANGADDSDVAETIIKADHFLAKHHFFKWPWLSRKDKRKVIDWAKTLDDYNNGKIGPGHCD